MSKYHGPYRMGCRAGDAQEKAPRGLNPLLLERARPASASCMLSGINSTAPGAALQCKETTWLSTASCLSVSTAVSPVGIRVD